jgi:hypothetical protein
MGLAWQTIQNTVRTWLLTYATSQSSVALVDVIFSKQKGPQPSDPFGVLTFSAARRAAGTFDELQFAYNSGGAAGQEITPTIIGTREFTVTAEVYVPKDTGQGTASEYLENALLALNLPSQRDAFNAIGISLIDFADIVNVTALLETVWEGRAVVDIRFRASDSATDAPTGYINTANITGSYTGP